MAGIYVKYPATSGGSTGSSTGVPYQVGPLDGAAANNNGATIGSSFLYMQSATPSFPGVVSSATQTFGGVKRFQGIVTVGSVTPAVSLNVGTTGTASAYFDNRVGIGTPTPQQMLHVGAASAIIQVSDTGSGGATMYLNTKFASTAGLGALQATGPVVMAPANGETARFTTAGQFVIGSTSAGSKFEVVDSSADIRVGNIGAGSFGGISFNGTLSVTDYNIASSLTDKNFYINRPSGVGVFFKEANGIAQMSIASGGNVTIGSVSAIAPFNVGVTGSSSAYFGGNVGVGKSNPICALDVAGQTATRGWMQIFNSSNTASLAGGDGRAALIFGANDQPNWMFLGAQTGDTAANTKFGLYSWPLVDWVMTWTNAGTVGLGTTVPTLKFDVRGSAQFYNDIAVTGSTSVRIREGAGQTNSEVFGIYSNDLSTTRMNVRNGVVCIGSTSPTALLNVSSSSGLSAFFSGNVGIGVLAPSQKLDVVGNIKGNGFIVGSTTVTASTGGSAYSIKLPGTQGSNSSVLANDGAGNLNWQVFGGAPQSYTPTIAGVGTVSSVYFTAQRIHGSAVIRGTFTTGTGFTAAALTIGLPAGMAVSNSMPPVYTYVGQAASEGITAFLPLLARSGDTVLSMGANSGPACLTPQNGTSNYLALSKGSIYAIIPVEGWT